MSRLPLRRRRKTRYLAFTPAIEKISGLKDQPDTVAAIVAGTILEGALETRLAGRMRRMSAKDHNELFHSGPLRNFQPKITLGQALSLFGPNTAMEMRNLANIRNIFAHTVRDISFDTPTVKRLCFELKRCELRAPPIFAAILIIEGTGTSSLTEHSVYNMIKSSAKFRYLYSTMMLVYMLESIPDDRPQRSHAPWPGFYG